MILRQQQMQQMQGNYPPPYSQHSQRMRMPFQQGGGNLGNDQQQFGMIEKKLTQK